VTFFADHSRDQLRAAYREAWRKWRAGLPLQPLEGHIAEAILAHPEYHPLLQNDASLTQDFSAAGAHTNPFLHLGLHLALREQISTDRPAGIAGVHRRLAGTLASEHAAEHRMIELLAETLWEAQRSGRPADEAVYLERLRRL